MPKSSVIAPAIRTEKVTYAVRDIIVLANETKKLGKEMLYLNIGDPNQFGFRTPDHLVEAAYQALRDNHNGYAPSSGIKQAVEAVEREAAKKASGTSRTCSLQRAPVKRLIYVLAPWLIRVRMS